MLSPLEGEEEDEASADPPEEFADDPPEEEDDPPPWELELEVGLELVVLTWSSVDLFENATLGVEADAFVPYTYEETFPDGGVGSAQVTDTEDTSASNLFPFAT